MKCWRFWDFDRSFSVAGWTRRNSRGFGDSPGAMAIPDSWLPLPKWARNHNTVNFRMTPAESVDTRIDGNNNHAMKAKATISVTIKILIPAHLSPSTKISQLDTKTNHMRAVAISDAIRSP